VALSDDDDDGNDGDDTQGENIVICVTIVTMPGISATKKSRHTQPV